MSLQNTYDSRQHAYQEGQRLGVNPSEIVSRIATTTISPGKGVFEVPDTEEAITNTGDAYDDFLGVACRVAHIGADYQTQEVVSVIRDGVIVVRPVSAVTKKTKVVIALDGTFAPDSVVGGEVELPDAQYEEAGGAGELVPVRLKRSGITEGAEPPP